MASEVKNKNSRVNYLDLIAPVGIIPGLSDSDLLEVVQKQTFRFFWHGAHPVSGLAPERITSVPVARFSYDIEELQNEPQLDKAIRGSLNCSIGGTGFGIMATIVAVERQWINREAAIYRLTKIVDFLKNADSYHGIFPHIMDGDTGKTVPFGKLDDGADLVETSYLLMGLLCAGEYFIEDTPAEKYLGNR